MVGEDQEPVHLCCLRLLPFRGEHSVETVDAGLFAGQLGAKFGTILPGRPLPGHKNNLAFIEARGCELLYLPPYSPDLSPIEEALWKVKHILRKIGARTKEALIEAMGRALGAVSTDDVRGFSFIAATVHQRSSY